DTSEIVAALAGGKLDGLLVGGVELADLPDPAAAREALRAAGFVVSLEILRSEVTELADVVLPVAAAVEKAGTFVTWEGRERPFPAVLPATGFASDHRVLTLLAEEFDVRLAAGSVDEVRAEIAELGTWDGGRPPGPAVAPAQAPAPKTGEAVLASWRMM